MEVIAHQEILSRWDPFPNDVQISERIYGFPTRFVREMKRDFPPILFKQYIKAESTMIRWLGNLTLSTWIVILVVMPFEKVKGGPLRIHTRVLFINSTEEWGRKFYLFDPQEIEDGVKTIPVKIIKVLKSLPKIKDGDDACLKRLTWIPGSLNFPYSFII